MKTSFDKMRDNRDKALRLERWRIIESMEQRHRDAQRLANQEMFMNWDRPMTDNVERRWPPNVQFTEAPFPDDLGKLVQS